MALVYGGKVHGTAIFLYCAWHKLFLCMAQRYLWTDHPFIATWNKQLASCKLERKASNWRVAYSNWGRGNGTGEVCRVQYGNLYMQHAQLGEVSQCMCTSEMIPAGPMGSHHVRTCRQCSCVCGMRYLASIGNRAGTLARKQRTSDLCVLDCYA